ncbi:uncharacterized protein ABDE67_006985 [Symphorus nematophorus]
MIGKDIALEALATLCNANVTSVQKQSSDGTPARFFRSGQQAQKLLAKQLISTILDADDTCEVSKCNFVNLRSFLQSGVQPARTFRANQVDIDSLLGPGLIIDENEFFDPQFDYDFTNLKDTETYYRGGEVYERPCGWQRYAIKVLDKYGDNTWLGTRYRSTQSVPGEWPVSYHGTSKSGAEGIIEEYYKPGPGQSYGRGVYSTPYMSDAVGYAKTFTSKSNGKTYRVILQNRINPQYRTKHNNDRYYLISIPNGPSDAEQDMAEMAIRPYGLLLQEV